MNSPFRKIAGLLLLLFAVSCASPVDHWQAAKAEWDQNDYLGAIIELNTCIANEQESDSIYFLRGRSYQRILNDSQALSDYTRALTFNPENGEAKLEKARIQLLQLDTINAGRSLRELTFHQQRRIASDAWIELGRMHYFADHFPEAIIDLHQAVVKDSSNYMAWYYRGLLFSRFFTPEGFTGKAYFPFLDMPAAINDFTESIRLKPDFADAWYQRAMVWFNLFDDASGMHDISEAIRLDSNSYYYAARGHQHMVAHRFTQALQDYNQSIALNSHDPEALSGRAELWDRLGKSENAARDRQAAEYITTHKR